MFVSLAHENVKNAAHPFCAFIAEILITLMKDKVIISTNNTLPSHISLEGIDNAPWSP